MKAKNEHYFLNVKFILFDNPYFFNIFIEDFKIAAQKPPLTRNNFRSRSIYRQRNGSVHLTLISY